MRQLGRPARQSELVGERQRVFEQPPRRVDDDAHRHPVSALDFGRAIVAAEVILALEQRDIELLLYEVRQGYAGYATAYDCQLSHSSIRSGGYWMVTGTVSLLSSSYSCAPF